MELGLAGKVAIVTGGSKGIGRATALGLIAEGASVLVCARGQEALDEVVAAAGAASRERIATIAADLTDGAAIKRVVAHCIAQFGRVDILINNAGSARPGEFLNLTTRRGSTTGSSSFSATCAWRVRCCRTWNDKEAA
jgi:3-oxoacyl-[acyl-carrier protein] reductase